MRVNKANHADSAYEAKRANAALTAQFAEGLSGGAVGSAKLTAADINKRFEKVQAQIHKLSSGQGRLSGDVDFLTTTAAWGEIPHLKGKIAALEEMLGIEWKEGGRYEGVGE